MFLASLAKVELKGDSRGEGQPFFEIRFFEIFSSLKDDWVK